MMVTAVAAAQETYDNAQLATTDLNGTARYVGMGGAMDALGADLSTISTNPAGIGLFRSSQVKASLGMMTQEGAGSFADADKTHMSFDQIGFVYSMRTGRSSFLNMAFNYHKSRDFNQILTAAGKLQNASQNQLTYAKAANGLFGVDDKGEVKVTNMYSVVDYLYWNAFIHTTDNQGNPEYGYNDASDYLFGRHNNGYIGVYDFNISGNINDRVYLGLTFGIHDVHYNSYTEYKERIVNATDNYIGDISLVDSRSVTGTGYDLKGGIIFRPVEDAPFRIGLSVATPTWFDLDASSHTQINNGTSVGAYDEGHKDEGFKFKVYTPWKVGLSLGTTVDNCLALGASYEFADYSGIDTRIITGDGYDGYTDSYYDETASDRAMNTHTKHTLRGVHTLKLGAEFKPDPSLAVRLGYNYVSPMYKTGGSRNVDVDSPYAYYATTTDYTNWKATNRITCGLGYTIDKFTLDVAYQYTTQNGTFYPFADYQYRSSDGESIHNTPTPDKVSNKRHHIMLTLGYTF